MLKHFFATRGIRTTERQVPGAGTGQPDKYRDVVLSVSGSGAAEKIALTLAVRPPAAAAQEYRMQLSECDQRLFTVLDDMESYLRRHGVIEIRVTEHCLDLTAQLPG